MAAQLQQVSTSFYCYHVRTLRHRVGEALQLTCAVFACYKCLDCLCLGVGQHALSMACGVLACQMPVCLHACSDLPAVCLFVCYCACPCRRLWSWCKLLRSCSTPGSSCERCVRE
jgi:hypothetical protein